MTLIVTHDDENGPRMGAILVPSTIIIGAGVAPSGAKALFSWEEVPFKLTAKI